MKLTDFKNSQWAIFLRDFSIYIQIALPPLPLLLRSRGAEELQEFLNIIQIYQKESVFK